MPKRKQPARTSKGKKAKVDEDTSQSSSSIMGEVGDLQWKEVKAARDSLSPMYYLSSKTLPGRQKVAAFDIDWTVIATESGRKFATGRHLNDWTIVWYCRINIAHCGAE